jgi:hypothetical protein
VIALEREGRWKSKGMEREEFPYKIELKFERDVDC